MKGCLGSIRADWLTSFLLTIGNHPDSIVRGTTSKEIIQMARDVGAKRVIMASCAPPIRYSNVYGIDMPSRQELVAHGRTEEEIAKTIGADLVIFQKLEDLVESCRQFNTGIDTFDCSVFTGEYVTGGVDEAYLSHIQSLREDGAKGKNAGASSSGMVTVNGNRTQQPGGGDGSEELIGCSGPMNGADAIGLYNEPHSTRKSSDARNRKDDDHHNSQMGLSNSYYAGLATMDIMEGAGVSEGANAVAGGAGAASTNPTR